MTKRRLMGTRCDWEYVTPHILVTVCMVLTRFDPFCRECGRVCLLNALCHDRCYASPSAKPSHVEGIMKELIGKSQLDSCPVVYFC